MYVFVVVGLVLSELFVVFVMLFISAKYTACSVHHSGQQR